MAACASSRARRTSAGVHVGRRRRVRHQGLGAAERGGQAADLGGLHEPAALLQAARQLERQQAAAQAHLPPGQLVLRVRGRERVADLDDALVGLEHLGEGRGGGTLLAQPHAEGAQPPDAARGVVGRRVGALEHGEAPDPVQELAAAGDDAERDVVVAADGLGRGVQREVHPVVERALAERRGERGVDDLHGALDGTEPVQVHQVEPRVGGRLGEQQGRRAGTHGGLPRVGVGAVHEGDVDPEPRAHGLEQHLRPGIELSLRDDVAAARAEPEHDGGARAHPRGERAGPLGPLQLCDRVLEGVHGRVAVAAVEAVGAGRRGHAAALGDGGRLERRAGPHHRGQRRAVAAPAGQDRRGLGRHRQVVRGRRLVIHGGPPSCRC